jgi:hypothetical protein
LTVTISEFGPLHETGRYIDLKNELFDVLNTSFDGNIEEYNKYLTENKAIKMAELFVLQNGYTDAPANEIKKKLDHESIEYANDREDLLQQRFNTLNRKAIGVRKGKFGKPDWSVAFDYVDTKLKDTCRVVTMDIDGSNIRVEHKEGIRSYFVGY